VQADLDATAARVERLSGKTMRRVVESLMSQRPGPAPKPGKHKKGSRPAGTSRTKKPRRRR